MTVIKFIFLRKNVQRKKGIKLTSDLEEVKNAYKSKYVMVQEKRDSIIVNKRRLNLRIYVFVVYTSRGKRAYSFTIPQRYYTLARM